MDVPGVSSQWLLALTKLERLRLDTARVLRRGTSTGRDMAELVGRWTWVMLITACFSAVMCRPQLRSVAFGGSSYGLWLIFHRYFNVFAFRCSQDPVQSSSFKLPIMYSGSFFLF